MCNRFPQKDEELLKQWREVVAPHTSHSNYVAGLICINHFPESAITKSNDLRKGALPNIFGGKFGISSNSNNYGLNERNTNNTGIEGNRKNNGVSNRSECDIAISTVCLDSIASGQSERIANDQQETPNEFPDEYLQIQYEELSKEIFKQQVNYGVQISNLEKQVSDLKTSLKMKNEQIAVMNKQIGRMEKANERLRNNMKELQQKDSVSQKALDVLQVVF